MGNVHLMATAMTAEMVLRGEKGDTGDTGSADPDVIAALQEQIDAKADSADAARPPMPEGAKVLAAGDADLSDMPDYYDPDMIMDAQTNSTAKAAKGTYTGKADVGFAGLNNLQAGGDGADVFGSWLEYSHWGIVMAENDDIGTFSLGMPTGTNPEPQDEGKLSAKWKGTMTGAWDPMETGANAVQKKEYETVRGNAEIRVGFRNTGTGYESSATLSIMNLVQADGTPLGHFMPGTEALGTITAGGEAAAKATVANYSGVWSAMKIGAGDFNRKSVTTDANGAAFFIASSVTDADERKTFLDSYTDVAGANKLSCRSFLWHGRRRSRRRVHGER